MTQTNPNIEGWQAEKADSQRIYHLEDETHEPSLTNAERERKLRIALRTLATVTTTSKAMREYAQATLKEVYGRSN